MTCLLHPTKGFTRGAVLDVDGVKTVLQLRSQYAEPKKELTDAGKYYDLSYYDKAKKELAPTDNRFLTCGPRASGDPSLMCGCRIRRKPPPSIRNAHRASLRSQREPCCVRGPGTPLNEMPTAELPGSRAPRPRPDGALCPPNKHTEQPECNLTLLPARASCSTNNTVIRTGRGGISNAGSTRLRARSAASRTPLQSRSANAAPKRRPPVRRTQESRSKAAREKLLNATLEVLRERGYNGLTTKEVAARAGFSNGALMHHYSTKADLVIAAGAHIYDQHIANGRTHGDKRRRQGRPIVSLHLRLRRRLSRRRLHPDDGNDGRGPHRSADECAVRCLHAALSQDDE